jgi:hypothetical protein
VFQENAGELSRKQTFSAATTARNPNPALREESEEGEGIKAFAIFE